VVPLIGHLIEGPVDAGIFVSGIWYEVYPQPPTTADFPPAIPWRGYSVRAFHVDMLSRPLTSYRIDPMLPRYDGPIFVLTSAAPSAPPRSPPTC
jgi:carboxyl-terminal processing protease